MGGLGSHRGAMTSPRQRLGHLGENLAHAYVKRAGWLVLERNWRCRHGELDLIGLEGNTLVVCEVRTRHGDRSGTALESVTRAKLRRIRMLTGEWIRVRGARPRSVRIDVIAIQIDEFGHHTLTHVRGVE